MFASILSNHKLYVFLIAFGHISQVSFKTSITDSKYILILYNTNNSVRICNIKKIIKHGQIGLLCI